VSNATDTSVLRARGLRKEYGKGEGLVRASTGSTSVLDLAPFPRPDRVPRSMLDALREAVADEHPSLRRNHVVTHLVHLLDLRTSHSHGFAASPTA
jgi:hypothetical protein